MSWLDADAGPLGAYLGLAVLALAGAIARGVWQNRKAKREAEQQPVVYEHTGLGVPDHPRDWSVVCKDCGWLTGARDIRSIPLKLITRNLHCPDCAGRRWALTETPHQTEAA